MLVVDSSGSISNIWNHTIDFCEKLLSNFNIADDQVRVGLIEFSMVANALIPLDSGNNLGRLYQSLEELRSRPQNGETHTDLALNLAYRVFLASKRTEPVPKVGCLTGVSPKVLRKAMISIVHLHLLLVNDYLTSFTRMLPITKLVS